jgi:hypothetical protein
MDEVRKPINSVYYAFYSAFVTLKLTATERMYRSIYKDLFIVILYL